MRDFVTRGKRLTVSTIADGVIVESIAELVAAAAAALGRPVDTNAYSVARMLRSEYSGGPTKALIAMAWVAKNDAANLGRDETATINAGTRHGVRYGTQTGGRYSTAHDPYENDLQIAEAVLAGEEPDPTSGAVKFVHTSGFAPGRLEEVEADWAQEGLLPLQLDGVGSLLVFTKDGFG